MVKSFLLSGFAIIHIPLVLSSLSSHGLASGSSESGSVLYRGFGSGSASITSACYLILAVVLGSFFNMPPPIIEATTAALDIDADNLRFVSSGAWR